MITRKRQPTVKTEMPALRQCLTYFRSASACLAGASWINFHKHAPSIFRFVREHKQKVRPPSIVDRLREHPARQSFDVQIFNGNQAVLINDLPRLFMVKVPALIANVVVKALKQNRSLAPAVRPFLSPLNPSLQASHLCLRGPKPTRVFYRSSIAQGGEAAQADINADHIGIERQRSGRALHYEQSKPPSSFTLHRESLNCAVKWSMQLDPNAANLRQAQPITRDGLSSLPKRHAVVAPGRSKTRVAWILRSFNAPKERLEREIDALQHVLKCREAHVRYVWPKRTDLFQLKILIEPANALALKSPSVAPLLQSSVVKLRANTQMLVEYPLLLFRWVDSIAKGFVQGASILTLRFSVQQREVEMESATWFTFGWEQAYKKRASGYGPIMPKDEKRRMSYAWKRSEISLARENDQREASGKARLWDGSIATLVGSSVR